MTTIYKNIQLIIRLKNQKEPVYKETHLFSLEEIQILNQYKEYSLKNYLKLLQKLTNETFNETIQEYNKEYDLKEITLDEDYNHKDDYEGHIIIDYVKKPLMERIKSLWKVKNIIV